MIGAFIGAAAPFLLWWVAESRRRRHKHFENLNYIERLLAEKINEVGKTIGTLRSFLLGPLEKLISNIKNQSDKEYAMSCTFFPLFATTELASDILKINTGSGFVDSKITRVRDISVHIPHIIRDAEKQLKDTIELNRQLCLQEKNTPKLQQVRYLENLEAYQTMLRNELLTKNLQVYLRVLVEAWTSLGELRRIGLLKWRLRFDPKFKFFLKHERYKKAKETLYEDISEFFRKRNAEELERINTLII